MSYGCKLIWKRAEHFEEVQNILNILLPQQLGY